jgi:DNA-binding CsgD family transcriptional regulator
MSARRASQFTLSAAASIHRLCLATSFSELESAAFQELSRLGLGLTVGAIVHRRPGAAQEVGFLFGRTAHPWIRHYDEAGLGANCPITGSAGPRPLTWDEIKAKPLTARHWQVFDQLRDFQFFNGFIVGIETLGPTMVVVSSAGRDADFRDPDARSLAHLISVNYGVLALAYWRAENTMPEPEPPRLTMRQIDCLRWVLEGKSSSVIADILGVSAKTVDEHLQKACLALGVRTRIQACAEAARLGLISL